jgi:hypothetical protein
MLCCFDSGKLDSDQIEQGHVTSMPYARVLPLPIFSPSHRRRTHADTNRELQPTSPRQDLPSQRQAPSTSSRSRE